MDLTFELAKLQSAAMDPWQIAFLTATLAGAWSVFPEPPRVVSDLFDKSNPNHQLWRHIALAVLLYQGAGGESITLSIAGAASLFALKMALDSLE